MCQIETIATVASQQFSLFVELQLSDQFSAQNCRNYQFWSLTQWQFLLPVKTWQILCVSCTHQKREDSNWYLWSLRPALKSGNIRMMQEPFPLLSMACKASSKRPSKIRFKNILCTGLLLHELESWAGRLFCSQLGTAFCCMSLPQLWQTM